MFTIVRLSVHKLAKTQQNL